MRTNRFFHMLVLTALLAAALFSRVPAAAQAYQGESPAAVIAWNGIAVRAIVNPATAGGAGQPPAHASITLSYVQAAVYNAVVAIEGGYEAYHSNLSPQPGASVDAAVAAAAHDILVHYLPTQQAALDAEYTTALANIPDSSAKAAGRALGQAAADEIITLRQGDGLLANVSFPSQAPGPGVWVLPPPASPLTPWAARVRPFLIASPSQFRPGPPVRLQSDRWVQDYNEVVSLGRSNSLTRTPAQTDAARFWTDHPSRQYNTAYTALILAQGLDAMEAARLYAMGNLVSADAAIACWDAKYHYQFWRPGPAIVAGASDNNPRTAGDAGWTPLIGTPPHPEYPGGHGCVTSAQAEVFTEFLGTRQIELDMTSTANGVVQTTRHFATAQALRQEIIEVRIWSGIHYRFSGETGADMGRALAHWGLMRFFQPVAP